MQTSDGQCTTVPHHAAQRDANCRVTVLRLSPTSWLAALGAVCAGLPVHLLWPCAYMILKAGQPMLSATYARHCPPALWLSPRS